jgi:Spy/CpxP family protein refolding chaperone
MQSPKTLLIRMGALALVLGITMAAGLAQESAPPPRQSKLDRPELNLTQEQRDQVQKIRADQHTKMQAIREDSSLSRSQRHAQMREVRKETHARIGEVLTAEQRAKLEQFRKEHRAKGGRHGHMGGGSGQPTGPDGQ